MEPIHQLGEELVGYKFEERKHHLIKVGEEG